MIRRIEKEDTKYRKCKAKTSTYRTTRPAMVRPWRPHEIAPPTVPELLREHRRARRAPRDGHAETFPLLPIPIPPSLTLALRVCVPIPCPLGTLVARLTPTALVPLAVLVLVPMAGTLRVPLRVWVGGVPRCAGALFCVCRGRGGRVVRGERCVGRRRRRRGRFGRGKYDRW